MKREPDLLHSLVWQHIKNLSWSKQVKKRGLGKKSKPMKELSDHGDFL